MRNLVFVKPVKGSGFYRVWLRYFVGNDARLTFVGHSESEVIVRVWASQRGFRVRLVPDYVPMSAGCYGDS